VPSDGSMRPSDSGANLHVHVQTVASRPDKLKGRRLRRTATAGASRARQYDAGKQRLPEAGRHGHFPFSKSQ